MSKTRSEKGDGRKPKNYYLVIFLYILLVVASFLVGLFYVLTYGKIIH